LVDCLPDKQIKLIKTGVSVELRGQLARRAGKDPDGIVSNPSAFGAVSRSAMR
jgi:hypothetical protein